MKLYIIRHTYKTLTQMLAQIYATRINRTKLPGTQDTKKIATHENSKLDKQCTCIQTISYL